MIKKVLIIGDNGMLGHTIFKYFNLYSKHHTFGILRDKRILISKNFLFKDYIIDLSHLNDEIQN